MATKLQTSRVIAANYPNLLEQAWMASILTQSHSLRLLRVGYMEVLCFGTIVQHRKSLKSLSVEYVPAFPLTLYKRRLKISFCVCSISVLRKVSILNRL
ncbi:hypothetical protein AVEN_4945-1 [Araneus ventricosus]|uniref:Uncharacterized protein n=1 Tax=Araneus ventricosus TaxID=182803 RepID=A0A4Y2E4W5_ARAVE|nr:hypothetical protein AVEN_4945-1 [Araneus ventricosus]